MPRSHVESVSKPRRPFLPSKIGIRKLLTVYVFSGDLSYAQGFGYGWEVYMDMMNPLIANMPYMVVEGFATFPLHCLSISPRHLGQALSPSSKAKAWKAIQNKRCFKLMTLCLPISVFVGYIVPERVVVLCWWWASSTGTMRGTSLVLETDTAFWTPRTLAVNAGLLLQNASQCPTRLTRNIGEPSAIATALLRHLKGSLCTSQPSFCSPLKLQEVPKEHDQEPHCMCIMKQALLLCLVGPTLIRHVRAADQFCIFLHCSWKGQSLLKLLQHSQPHEPLGHEKAELSYWQVLAWCRYAFG